MNRTIKIQNGEIYTFKLVTGEELIARVVTTESEHYELESPISVVLSPQGLQMMPSLFSSMQERNVLLNKTACAMIGEPREDVNNGWIQATTGIAPVTRKIITG
jgi:hypothetical protein